MPDDDLTTQNAVATVGAGPVAKEIYNDLLRPAAQELSKPLLDVAKLVTLALTPLHGAVLGVEKIGEWLGAALVKRLRKVAPEHVQSPPAFIAGPILLQLPFCADQHELREMYANLLARAMNTEQVGEIHPAFIEVVRQLTPDEALILQKIDREGGRYSVSESVPMEGYPRQPIEYITDKFRRFCGDAGVTQLALTDAYLDNLLRLRIFNELQWDDNSLHRPTFAAAEDIELLTSACRTVEVSSFGGRFLKACISDPSGGGAEAGASANNSGS